VNSGGAKSGAGEGSNWKGQGKGKGCFFCGDEKHIERNCPAYNAAKSKHRSGEGSSESGGGNGDSNVYMTSTQPSGETAHGEWIVDSAATEHMCKDRSLFTCTRPGSRDVRTGDGTLCRIVEEGEVDVMLHNGNEVVKGVMTKVLHTPHLRRNLFSVPAACDNDKAVTFWGNQVVVYDAKDVVLPERVRAVGYREERLYKLRGEEVSESHLVTSDVDVWHRRLGHLGVANVKELQTKGMVRGMETPLKGTVPETCEGCAAGHPTRAAFNSKPDTTPTNAKLELVHTDVCGPMAPSYGGARYFITFTDDYTKKVWQYPMEGKHDALEKFVQFTARVERQSGKKLKKLRCDRGGEYINKAFELLCEEEGIELDKNPPRSPELNGVAERLNRTLEEKATAMLAEKGLPKGLWAEAVRTAAYVKNRSPCSALKRNVTPDEAWTGHKPTVKYLRVFGSPCDVLVPKSASRKFEKKSWRGIFVGYEGKSYRIWDPERRKLSCTRDVTVHENSVYGGEVSEKTTTLRDVDVTVELEGASRLRHEHVQEPSTSEGAKEGVAQGEMPQEGQPEEVPEMGRGKRVKKPNTFYTSYLAFTDSTEIVTDDPVDGISYCYFTSSADSPSLKEAIEEEIKSQEKNKVWDLVERPEGKPMLGSIESTSG
jgi:transposase InsO family protein